MHFSNLLLESADGLATITVHRPDKLNALNHATLVELAAAFDAVKVDATVRGLLITGSGPKAFIAGADIEELSRMTPLAAKDLAYFGQQVYARLEKLGKPSIAMINGFALGGGLELALACTLRTISATAKVGLPEVSLGIIPGYGGTQRLARIAGPGVAREWVLTGDMYDAAEAHRVGVVNRVSAPEALLEDTRKLAQRILSRGPVAVRLALETIARGQNMTQQEGELIECDMFALAATTNDMKEGMRAFLEKRKANFTNS
jgi:enoyl-CoA hydratase